MVHKHRAAVKATIAKDISPMRSISSNKYTCTSSPSDGSFHLGARSAVSAATTNFSANKWQYNDMINNNRDQFNNMHFC